MGRHEAPVPAERRLVGGALGVTTIVLLLWLVWAISQPAGDAVTTSTLAASTSVPTTELSTTMAPPPTTAPPDTSPVTTATTTTVPLLHLSPDGVGIARFGDSPDEALEAVTGLLGPADEDSGWIPSISDFGICPGTEVRVVRWAGLRFFFSDGPTNFADDTRHFFYYSQSPVADTDALDLRTPDGIGLGSTVAQLRAAYGGDVAISSTVRFGPVFSLEGSEPGLISGSLSGIGDNDVVTLVGGGFGCGA